jgi:hypothetical protein
MLAALGEVVHRLDDLTADQAIGTFDSPDSELIAVALLLIVADMEVPLAAGNPLPQLTDLSCLLQSQRTSAPLKKIGGS